MTAPSPAEQIAAALADASTLTPIQTGFLAAALMPTVDRLIREGAAEELAEALAELVSEAEQIGAAQYVIEWLRARAADLTAAAPTEEKETNR